jgi:hypothetical protein
MAFLTLPAADAERAAAHLKQADLGELKMTIELLDECHHEFPRVKAVGVDDRGFIKFERIHSVMDASRGRA